MKSIDKLFCLLFLLLLTAFQSKAEGERVFTTINASDGLADNSAQTIVCTKTGRMVVTTIGNINFFDGAEFSHVDISEEKIVPLANYHGHYHIYFDNLHHMWLKSSSGVACVNLTLERYIGNVDSVFTSLGMEETVTDLFADSDGNLWLEGSKSIFCPQLKKSFPVLKENNLQDLDVVDQRRLLMFYENGELMEFDLKTEKVLYRGMAYSYEDAHTYYRSTVMLRYKGGYYQIRNGEKKSILLHFDLKTREWKTLMRMDYHLNNLAEFGDMLYLPSEYGYWTYDILTGETKHYEKLKLKNGSSLATDINTICFDKQGGMWVGTEKCGLLYSRMLAVPFKTYTWDTAEALRYDAMIQESEANTLISNFNGKKATCMFIDSRNWTWVGAPTGLSCFKTPQSDPIVITRREGLLNNVIHSIIEDDLHNIWVSTSYGITCVVIDQGKVRYVMSFNDNDNVPNETFYNGSVMKLEDGSIVMKAENHIVVFNPKTFGILQKENRFTLYPKLVRLLVNGNVIAAGKEVDGSIILQKAVTRVREIDLNYDQNTLSMVFSGLNYIRPLQTFYRVRVKGVIDDWTVLSYYNSGGKVDKKGLLHLPLNLLKPGTYTVEVQTSLFPDEWNTEPYTWIIHINEPWWRTSGMIALLSLILLVLAVLNVILFNRNTRMKMKRNSDEGDIIRRIKNFIDRCDSCEDEVLAPSHDEIYGVISDEYSQLTDEFISAMTDIVPYVHELRGNAFTMHNLSEETGISIVELYQIVSGNLYKSPMLLARSLRLQHAASLLEETDKSIEDIALECKFCSPNFFIANFYHKFKQTPYGYRAERSISHSQA